MSYLSPARSAVAGLAIALLASPILARDARVGTLRLTGAWSRPTPPGAPAGAGYVTIINTGTRLDRLLSGSSPAVDHVEVHERKLDGGVMRMRPIAGGIAVPGGRSVALAPGGYHLMLIGPKKPFAVGGTVPVTLRFERAGTVRVLFDVTATPPEEHAAGDHH